MTTWTLRAHGSADAAEVWDRYDDTRRWAQWAPQLKGVETDGGHRLAAGLTGTVRPVVGPGVRFRVDRVDAGARTWSWTARVGPIRLRLDHGVEPDGGTWLRVHGPLPVLVGYLPVARFALSRLVRA